MKTTHARKESGASFLEFLMVAPILLLICGSTVELARFIRYRQIADVLSKEAATRAYRECDINRVTQQNSGPVVDQNNVSDAITNCLTEVRDDIEGIRQGLDVQASIILSAYRFQPGELVPFRPGDSNPLGRPLCSTEAVQRISTNAGASQYSPAQASITGPNSQNVAPWGCDTGRVFIAEVTFNYRPIIGFRVFGIGDSFDTDFRGTQLNGTFRETTIL